MPETIPQIRPSFRSLRLETRPELLSADTGALVQRELMDRSGLIDWLTGRLHAATPDFDPLSAVGSARLDSCSRAGATSPTTHGWRHGLGVLSAGRRTFRHGNLDSRDSSLRPHGRRDGKR